MKERTGLGCRRWHVIASKKLRSEGADRLPIENITSEKWQRVYFRLYTCHPHTLQNSAPFCFHFTKKFEIHRCQITCSSFHSYNGNRIGIKQQLLPNICTVASTLSACVYWGRLLAAGTRGDFIKEIAKKWHFKGWIRTENTVCWGETPPKKDIQVT